MHKRILLLLVLAISFTACKKNGNKTACGTQMCDASFAYLGIVFHNHDDSPVGVKDLKMVNMRTGKAITLPPFPPNVDFIAGAELIASDATKGEYSTEGDDVRITATSATTGQVKTLTIKISGGCNCHVAKISGPDIIKFD